MRNPVERSRRLRNGTNWRTFMRLLRLDDPMTSYTHGRHIAIPEKSVFRLISHILGMRLSSVLQITWNDLRCVTQGPLGRLAMGSRRRRGIGHKRLRPF